MNKKLCALAVAVLAAFCVFAAACGNGGSSNNGNGGNTDGKADWSVQAETEKDDMTISVTGTAKTGETFAGAEISLYYGDELVESKAAAESVSFEAPHHGIFTVKLIKDEQTLVETEAKVWASSYRIAYFNATLPVTMFMTSVFSDQSGNLEYLQGESGFTESGACAVPTYIYLERTQTFNWDELPENAYAFPSGNVEWWSGFYAASDFIAELYSMDSSSVFSFNFADNYATLVTLFAWRNQLPAENYTVNIWTDGTGTYNGINGSVVDQSAYDAIRSAQEDLSAEMEAAADSDARFELAEEYIAEWIDSEEHPNQIDCFGWSFVFACENENVNYAVNSLEGLFTDTDNEEIAAFKELAEENLTVVPLNAMLSVLRADEAGFRAFEFLYQTRWIGEDGEEHSYSDIFGASEKPNLLILGTSVSGEAVSDAQPYTFLEYYEYLQKAYGDTYDIFYKAHPSYPIDSFEDGRAQLFEEDGVVDITPAQIPVELFMFFYEDVYICGYFGSSFYSSQKGQTICFFNTEAVVRANETALAMIEEGIFEGTVYLGDLDLKSAA